MISSDYPRVKRPKYRRLSPLFEIRYLDRSLPWESIELNAGETLSGKGGGRRIRTFGRDFSPYNGLADP